MTAAPIVFYDYQHCREFLEDRSRQLREGELGLNQFALYRELFYSFSSEALESGALTLGQFDHGIVYLFVPEGKSATEYPQGHKVAHAKAIELLDSNAPPLVIELLSSQDMEPPVGDRARITQWMRPDFLNEVIFTRRVTIQLFFNAQALLDEIIKPELEKRGFAVADSYIKSARSGEIRVRHPSTPGKLYRMPWLLWTREMMGGGYSIVYMMTCFATFLQKLQGATTEKTITNYEL